jgi:WD40 repeat protein
MEMYDAFISYSRGKDKPIAIALQSVTQSLGKPWYRARALHVFRDDTSLSAAPALWDSIERSLAQSRYFILLASLQAAASKWVNREVAYWLDHNSVDTLLIGVTDGELTWNDANADFIWDDNTPLPSALARKFIAEPKWVDLRAYRGGANPRDAKFIELAADFAATIHGLPKERLLSHDVRQQRRARTLACGAAALLLVLSAIAYWQWQNATTKAREVAAQRDQTLVEQSRFLADAARQQMKYGDSATATALALEALPDANNSDRRPYVSEAELSLYESVTNLSETAVLAHKVTTGGMSWTGPEGAGQDVSTGEEMIQYALDRLPMGIHMVAAMGGIRGRFNYNGSMIVTWGNDGARVWSTNRHRQLAFLHPRELGVDAAAFSPDGLRLVTIFPDQTARVWNTADWSEVSVLRGHSSGLITANFSPDGTHVVTGSWDETARLWDAVTGRRVLELRGHVGGINIAFFSTDGRRITTASDDKTVRVWDAATGQQLIILSGHTESVVSAQMSPDGKRIATAANDGTARLWDASTGRQLGYLAESDSVTVAFSPDGMRAIVALRNGAAKIVDVDSLAEVALLRGHTRAVLDATYSPSGSLIVTGSNDGSARLWDARSGTELRTFRGHNRGILGVAFSPDSTAIVTMSFDGTARLWQTSGRKMNVISEPPSPQDISQVQNSDGNRVLKIFEDHSVRIVDARTQAELSVLKGHKGTVFSASFSADGSRVITSSYDATARIWDSYSGREIAVLRGHTGGVLSAAFSPDGSRVATGSSDKTARVWDVNANATVALIRTPDYEVFHVKFSMDGTGLITTNQKGEGSIWPLFRDSQGLTDYAKSLVPRCLTQEQRRRFFLPQRPPYWCIEMAKWPYDTSELQQSRRANDRPSN